MAGPHEWEVVQQDTLAMVRRMAVPGGWLYAYHHRQPRCWDLFVTTVFVPLPDPYVDARFKWDEAFSKGNPW